MLVFPWTGHLAGVFAQAGGAGSPIDNPLAQYGLLGAILSITFAFVWYVLNGYRKDNAELKAENKDLNLYLRERVVPLLESCASALKETSASNAEVVKALTQVTFMLNDRSRGG